MQYHCDAAVQLVRSQNWANSFFLIDIIILEALKCVWSHKTDSNPKFFCNPLVKVAICIRSLRIDSARSKCLPKSLCHTSIQVLSRVEKFHFVNDRVLEVRTMPVWNFCWSDFGERKCFVVHIAFTHSGNVLQMNFSKKNFANKQAPNRACAAKWFTNTLDHDFLAYTWKKLSASATKTKAKMIFFGKKTEASDWSVLNRFDLETTHQSSCVNRACVYAYSRPVSMSVEGETPLEKFYCPLENSVGHSLWPFGIVKNIRGPSENCSPPDVPSQLRACWPTYDLQRCRTSALIYDAFCPCEKHVIVYEAWRTLFGSYPYKLFHL